MLQDKVTRLRQLLSEAVPKEDEPLSAEAAAARAFRIYELNSPQPLLVEQTARARAEREIERIASWYRWDAEIVRALDRAGASSLSLLEDHEVDDLLQRMKQLEDCVREGLDCPDTPPAR